MTKRTVYRSIRSGICSCVSLLPMVMLGTGCGEASPQPYEISMGVDAGATAAPITSADATTNTQPTTTAGTNADPITNTGGNTTPTGGTSGATGLGGTGAMNTVDASTTLDGSAVVTGAGGSPDPKDATTPSEQEPENPTTEPSGGSDIPDNAYCAPVADWDPAWAAFEEEVVVLTNQHRTQGADCTSGSYPPAKPLTMEPRLRCAARVHSKDMADRDFYDHYSPEGTSPFQRMAEAGYPGGGLAENISYGQSSAAEAVQGWMDSDGHCVNIMRSNLTEIGVGFFDGSTPGQWPPQKMWTQTFGGGGW